MEAAKLHFIFTKGGYSEKDVEKLMLSMPFKRFEDMGFIRHSKFMGLIQLDKHIMRNLTDEDIRSLKNYSDMALKRYFGE